MKEGCTYMDGIQVLLIKSTYLITITDSILKLPEKSRKRYLDASSPLQGCGIFRSLPSVLWVPKFSSPKFSGHPKICLWPSKDLPHSTYRTTSRSLNLRKPARISCQNLTAYRKLSIPCMSFLSRLYQCTWPKCFVDFLLTR